MRGQPFYRTIRNANARNVWERYEFPTFQPVLHGNCERWFAARSTLHAPFCFTPTERFHFGGEEYIPLYPCVAFATRNFGFIIQRKWNGFTWGRE
jgi:hypothetical protein